MRSPGGSRRYRLLWALVIGRGLARWWCLIMCRWEWRWIGRSLRRKGSWLLTLWASNISSCSPWRWSRRSIGSSSSWWWRRWWSTCSLRSNRCCACSWRRRRNTCCGSLIRSRWRRWRHRSCSLRKRWRSIM